MERKTGYLASLFNIPPLIFRFQFNPTIVSDKKSYKYDQAQSFGQWGFDKFKAGSGFVGSALGLWDDTKEITSLLVATKPMEAKEGQPRTIGVEFELDSTRPGPLDGDDHYGGSIEPDLAILRAFMYPTWTAMDITKMIATKEVLCWNRPPECEFKYGSFSVTCVMTDLNIKVTAFKDDGKPQRAEVNVTLKEQTYSISPMVEYAMRAFYEIPRSYGRKGIGKDFLRVTPIVGMFF